MSHVHSSAPLRLCASALITLVCFSTLSLRALAQDEALDADPRPYDKVWLTSSPDTPIECTIIESGDPGKVKFKKKGETIEVTVDTGQIVKRLPRQTPLDALKERSERIKAGTADEHRKLGDWAWRAGLEPEALVELRKAVSTAADATASIPFRARLARVLLLRAGHVDGDERDQVFEELVKLQKKCAKENALSPEVELGMGRALLAQGIAPPAVPHLERARDGLAKEASGPPVTEEPPAKPVVKVDEPPRKEEPPKKDDKKKDDGTRPIGPRRGDRDGEGGNRDKKPVVQPKIEAVPSEDHSQEKWPGIVSDRRLVYREVLLALAEAYIKTDRAADAVAALGPLVEAWPQDKAGLALRARARLAVGDSKGAVLDLAPAIAAYPEDAALIRDRGIASYVAGDLDAAKADLEKALAQGLDDPRSAHAHLGFVHLRRGFFKAAKAAFDAASSSEVYGLAKLGLGVLAELQGRADDAATLYEEARPLLEADGLVSYSIALARIRGARLEDARNAIKVALREGLPFPVGARILAVIARNKGDAKGELRALEELVGSGSTGSADDLYALGRAYAGVERVEDARLTFDRAIAAVATHVPSLLGAGWVRYVTDDREAARDFFQKALTLASAKQADPTAPATPDIIFAKRALKNLEDARTRKVWVERFDREDGDVKNGWTPILGYGIEIGIKGKKLVFEGSQKSEQDGGKTRLIREVTGQTVLKVEAKLDLSKAPADVRAGIRFETEKGSAILYRDGNSLCTATSLQGMQITSDPEKIFAWPKDDRPHILAIEIEDPAMGIVSFWLDGERRADVKIAQMGRAAKPVVSVFTAAPVDKSFVVTVEEVRIYAQKPVTPGKSGGF